MDYLKKLNPHILDNGVSLDEKSHIYNINGDKSYTSVTKWNNSNFPIFNENNIINSMMNSSNWINNKYYGMDKYEIKKIWKKNRIEASSLGTKLHNDIESYYNKIIPENTSIEYQYFLNFVNDNKNLIPFRTEWIVYDKNKKIAGSVDMVYINEDNTLDIYDWKRCKEIIKTNNFNKWANKKCIEHIPDTNFWHYSIQLNTYKKIIEKNYNYKIKNLYLVCLHPDNNNNNYQKIKVPNLDNEIEDLFNIIT